MLLTVVGLVLVVLAYFTDHTRSTFNNIILLMFVTSIGLGSLFLVAIEYLGGAVWSTPFRRLAEFLASVLLVVPILAIPIYFNLHDVYHWTHEAVVKTDEILSHKSPYLNESFFTIRIIGYFVIWILFYFLITKNSNKQDDTKDQTLTKKNIRISGIFIPFFAITLTFSAIDWMMSLEPHWFSTIFGVYYFAGTFLSALAFITFLIIYFNEKGVFGNLVVKDHYYSFGVLLFGFVNFWAYIAFSQFLLIWYANLPEETFWFINRVEGSWLVFTIIYVFIHFLIPFFALVSQPTKTHPGRLKFMSIWLLIAHYLDLYFIVMPTFSKDGVIFGWIELGFFLLAFGIVLLMLSFKSKNKNIIPVGDPKLKRGIDFRL
ncbi:MAG: quinol:cytochrome C oxidoreductase [Ignavibacteriae bacterium]|nr:MAG: quinol:cytochrome C oxidoreductase [Ignavibacteriota bacterium]